MDRVKFAQMCEIERPWNAKPRDYSKVKKLKEIAKGINVNYCIPDGPSIYLPRKNLKIDQRENFSGYNCLHFTILHSDYELIDKFLSEGADLFQQGTFDGCTPIHLAIIKHHHIQGSIEPVWELLGPLREDKSLNLLLSTQIQTGNTLNPKCKFGISHFHVACMVDHIEAVEFFLKNGEAVNQVMDADSQWPGYTPLHFAVRYACKKAVNLLIEHGADFFNEDARGQSPLHLAIEGLISTYDYFLVGDFKDDFLLGRDIEKFEKIINSIVTVISQKKSILDFVCNDGLTICHVASMMKEQSLLEKFLNENFDLNVTVNSDSSFWSSWTPLHFAACTNYENFKLLLKYGAKADVENANGDTPLDLLMKRLDPKIVSDILSTEDTFKNIILSDNETKLTDTILAMNDSEAFNVFIDNLKDINVIVPANSPIWSGNNLLHLALSSKKYIKHDNDTYKAREFMEHHNCDWPSKYFLDEVEKKRYYNVIETCIKKECKVDEKNAKGDTPIHMIFKMHKEERVKEWLKLCENDAVDSNNFSIFHIACMMNDVELVEKLLNKGTDVNSCIINDIQHKKRKNTEDYCLLRRRHLVKIRAKSTALHMAVIFENEKMVKLLLSRGANLYAQDSADLTPIHLSLPMFNSNKQNLPEIILPQASDLTNMISKDGLSHFHVAAFANDRKSLEKLIEKGANIHIVTTAPERFAGQTPLHVAVNQKSVEAIKVLIEAGANIHKENALKKYETPLLYAVQSSDDETIKHFVEKIKTNEYCTGPIDPSGLTLLHLACFILDLRWATEILKKGANPNAQIRTDFDFPLAGFTPLHILRKAIIITEYEVQEIIPFRESDYSEQFVYLLLRYGADVTIISNYEGSPIHMLYHERDPMVDFIDILNIERSFRPLKDIAQLLLKRQSSYDVNPVDNEECNAGFTHFHMACMINNVEIVKKFLDNGVDINHMVNPFVKCNPGYTGLHFAMMYHCSDVARFLIERGADLKIQDSHGNTPFHTAMKYKFSDMDFIQMLVECGADVHTMNINLKTPFDCLVESSGLNSEKLLFFLNHGCNVDNMYTVGIKRGLIGLALKNVPEIDALTVFENLMDNLKLKSRLVDGFNPIYNAVAIDKNYNDEISTNTYVNVISRLIDMGCDIDERDCHGFSQCASSVFAVTFTETGKIHVKKYPEGITPLHGAIEFGNVSAVQALLQLGADINIVEINRFGKKKPPFDMNVINDCDMGLRIRDWHYAIKITKILAAHVWKMKFLGFHVHRVNEKTFEKACKMYIFDNNVPSACRAEMKKMEEKKFSATMNLKKFITSRALVCKYSTMSIITRDAINNFFKDFYNLRKEYPEFCGLLMMKYRKIQNRMKMFQEAKDALVFLTSARLPDLCNEAILQFLTNEEIKDFIDNVSKIRPILDEKFDAEEQSSSYNCNVS